MLDLAKQVVYQIYPKSFKDSNGDGVGDLPGIIEKLPYLAKLGVDFIWLNPFYPSPQNDNGYDISDYCAVDPLFGTMNDFETLVTEANKLNINVIIDMVFNHVSTDHVWFQKALAGDKQYQDYFLLRERHADGSHPNHWQSKFGGPAWAPFGDTKFDFLHLYDPTQADLNWRNPAVVAEIKDVLDFWLAKGVRGFRFDVINVIGKDLELIDAPAGTNEKLMYTDKPIVHDYIRELNEATFGKYENVITVGELSSTTIENANLYTRPDRHELSMSFSFHHLKVDYENGEKWTKIPYDFTALRNLLHEWGTGMAVGGGMPAWFWNNHDQPRGLNRFILNPKFYDEGARLLAMVVHLNRGVPYIYMGEEIGMRDPEFTSIDQYNDIEAHNAYQMLLDQGKTSAEAFAIVKTKARDNARTPMQWDNSTNAGFTTGTPWLGLAEYSDVNVATELAKDANLYVFYQKLIQLRKTETVIADGGYTAAYTDVPEVFAFVRELNGQKLLMVAHFGEAPTQIDLGEFADGELVISSYADTTVTTDYQLRPYEALALKIN